MPISTLKRWNSRARMLKPDATCACFNNLCFYITYLFNHYSVYILSLSATIFGMISFFIFKFDRISTACHQILQRTCLCLLRHTVAVWQFFCEFQWIETVWVYHLRNLLLLGSCGYWSFYSTWVFKIKIYSPGGFWNLMWQQWLGLREHTTDTI